MEDETTTTPPAPLHQGITVIGAPEARAALWAAMGKARASFERVTKSIKGQTGNQTFMYSNFAQLSAAMVEPLAENGLSIIQMITTPSPEVGCVTTLLAGHGAELWVEIKFPTSDNEHGFQATIKDFGAATTYYKRYAIQAIGFIEGDRDAESAPDMRGPGRVTGPIRETPPDPRLGEIQELAESIGWGKGKVQAFAVKVGIKKPLEQMNDGELKVLLAGFKEQVKIEQSNGAPR